MAEPDSIPDVFAEKRRKGISKDPNPDSFWIDMPFLIQIAKAKEENPNWGAKSLLKNFSVCTFTMLNPNACTESRRI